jgi:hypothetical protein
VRNPSTPFKTDPVISHVELAAEFQIRFIILVQAPAFSNKAEPCVCRTERSSRGKR